MKTKQIGGETVPKPKSTVEIRTGPRHGKTQMAREHIKQIQTVEGPMNVAARKCPLPGKEQDRVGRLSELNPALVDAGLLPPPLLAGDEESRQINDLPGKIPYTFEQASKLLPPLDDDSPDIIDEAIESQTLEDRLLNDGPETLTFDEKLVVLMDATARKKEAKAVEKDANKIINAIMDDLVDEFIERETTSIRKKGRTFYLHSQGWAKIAFGDGEDRDNPADKITARARAVAALNKCGYGECVTVSYQTLSAIMREMKKNKEDFPEGFDGAIEFEPTMQIRVRKSK